MSDEGRVVTVHRVADRHRELHGREFAETLTVETSTAPLRSALAEAVDELGLAEDTGKVVITVGWPHELTQGTGCT